MVNGVPVAVLNQMAMRDNYAPPPVSSFIPAAVMNLAEGVISKYNFKKPEPKVSQEDIDRAAVIVEPIIEKAAQAALPFSYAVHELAEKVGAVGVIIGPVKTVERTALKLADKDDGANWDTNKLRDIIRSTVVVGSYAEAQAVVDAIRRDFEVVAGRIKNRTDQEISGPDVSNIGFLDSGYGDVLVNVWFNGVQAEIQINVPEMLSAKGAEGHKLYEIEAQLKRDSDEYNEVVVTEKEFYSAAASAANFRHLSSESGMGSVERTSDALRSTPPSRANQPSIGMNTNSPPGSVSKNSVPAGNLSGTGKDVISGTSGKRLSHRLGASGPASPRTRPLAMQPSTNNQKKVLSIFVVVLSASADNKTDSQLFLPPAPSAPTLHLHEQSPTPLQFAHRFHRQI